MHLPSVLKRARSALTFMVRLTVAALLALFMGHLLDVRLPLWVVLTAMIVTQTSLGRSLKVALDYFAGTLLGALWGGIVVMFVPHTNEVALLVTLGLALAPLAFLTAVEPRYATAPITAAIVLLMAQTASLTPIASVMERLIEVGLGGLVGLFISLFLFPSSAFQHIRERAADILEEMGRTTSGLADGFKHGLDTSRVRSLQTSIGPLFSELGSVVGEADQEKNLRLGSEDTGPLFRSLLRLRHDLVIMGRAVAQPLPAALTQNFGAAAEAIERFFVSGASSLRSAQAAPTIGDIDAAVLACATAVDGARRAGDLRSLSSDELEHLFAMGFAIEQMRRNIGDLARCIDEWGD